MSAKLAVQCRNGSVMKISPVARSPIACDKCGEVVPFLKSAHVKTHDGYADLCFSCTFEELAEDAGEQWQRAAKRLN